MRAWDPAAPTPAFLFDEICGKSSTGSSQGWLDHYLEFGATAQPQLSWEIVEVDRIAPAAKPTPTGFREVVLEAWAQPVSKAPLA